MARILWVNLLDLLRYLVPYGLIGPESMKMMGLVLAVFVERMGGWQYLYEQPPMRIYSTQLMALERTQQINPRGDVCPQVKRGPDRRRAFTGVDAASTVLGFSSTAIASY